jgi:hypothetical protein
MSIERQIVSSPTLNKKKMTRHWSREHYEAIKLDLIGMDLLMNEGLFWKRMVCPAISMPEEAIALYGIGERKKQTETTDFDSLCTFLYVIIETNQCEKGNDHDKKKFVIHMVERGGNN